MDVEKIKALVMKNKVPVAFVVLVIVFAILNESGII
jgi:hypothetical protein